MRSLTYAFRYTVFVWCSKSTSSKFYIGKYFFLYFCYEHTKLWDLPLAHFISIYLVHCAFLFAIHLTVILQLAPIWWSKWSKDMVDKMKCKLKCYNIWKVIAKIVLILMTSSPSLSNTFFFLSFWYSIHNLWILQVPVHIAPEFILSGSSGLIQ